MKPRENPGMRENSGMRAKSAWVTASAGKIAAVFGAAAVALTPLLAAALGWDAPPILLLTTCIVLATACAALAVSAYALATLAAHAGASARNGATPDLCADSPACAGSAAASSATSPTISAAVSPTASPTDAPAASSAGSLAVSPADSAAVSPTEAGSSAVPPAHADSPATSPTAAPLAGTGAGAHAASAPTGATEAHAHAAHAPTAHAHTAPPPAESALQQKLAHLRELHADASAADSAQTCRDANHAFEPMLADAALLAVLLRGETSPLRLRAQLRRFEESRDTYAEQIIRFAAAVAAAKTSEKAGESARATWRKYGFRLLPDPQDPAAK